MIVDEADALALGAALQELTAANPNIKVDEYLQILELRRVFLSTKLKAVKQASIWNMVLDDLAYFKQKVLNSTLTEKSPTN